MANAQTCRHEQVETAEKLALGVILGNYKATRHKAKPQCSTLTEVAILAPGLKPADLARAADVAKGVLLARSLVESPANLCTPQYMADAARSVADSAPDCMQLKVRRWPLLSRSQLLRLPASMSRGGMRCGFSCEARRGWCMILGTQLDCYVWLLHAYWTALLGVKGRTLSYVPNPIWIAIDSPSKHNPSTNPAL